MGDRTIHRCKGTVDNCGRVARWEGRDGEWTCKDHARIGAVHVMPEPLPPPPELEGELIGSRLELRVKR